MLDAMRIIMPPPPWESVRIVGTVICYRNESHPAAASTEITRNDVRGENSLLRPSYDLPSSALSHDLVPLSPKARSCFFLLRICLQPRPMLSRPPAWGRDGQRVLGFVFMLITRMCSSYQVHLLAARKLTHAHTHAHTCLALSCVSIPRCFSTYWESFQVTLLILFR